jgi:hypothetical protein
LFLLRYQRVGVVGLQHQLREDQLRTQEEGGHLHQSNNNLNLQVEDQLQTQVEGDNLHQFNNNLDLQVEVLQLQLPEHQAQALLLELVVVGLLLVVEEVGLLLLHLVML